MEEKNSLNVALLAGGKSSEREVSLKGAEQVKGALLELGHRVYQYDPACDLERLLKEAPDLDCAFLVLHGAFGEDGRIQGFLDMIGLPYQGAGVMGSAMAMDKHISKTIYEGHGIPTPRWLLVQRGMREPSVEKIVDVLGLPIMVKPRTQGSSIGMGIARDEDDIQVRMEQAFEWDEFLILEQYIQGREISVGVLETFGDETLPPIEIVPGKEFEFFDYKAKYTPGATQEICPAPLEKALERQARDLAKKAHYALGLSDYSRTDMLLGDDGSLLVIETNTIPGMTATSLFPQEAKEAGLCFKDLVGFLLMLAFKKGKSISL